MAVTRKSENGNYSDYFSKMAVIIIVAFFFTCLISIMGYDKLSLRKPGGGALECYLGINLRSKTS